MTSDTDWNKVFHVSESYTSPKIEHKPEASHLDQRKNKPKKIENRRREQIFNDNYELETDFSDDLKSLKPQVESGRQCSPNRN